MSLFRERIIEIVKMIPYGNVASYGQVALLAGIPRAARQVGNVLNKLEGTELELPWWRVVNNAGRISIKGPRHNADMQKKLLEAEGLVIKDTLQFDIEKYRWRPDPSVLQSLKLDDEYIEKILEKYLI